MRGPKNRQPVAVFLVQCTVVVTVLCALFAVSYCIPGQENIGQKVYSKICEDWYDDWIKQLLNKLNKEQEAAVLQELYIGPACSYQPYILLFACHSPLAGMVTSEFGQRTNPITQKEDFHTGIDIAAPEGDTIYSATGGIVQLCSSQGDYGNHIIVLAGENVQVLYAHCSNLLVAEGDVIKIGQPIALVGSTGMATGSHLHFEIRIDDICVNPSYVL